MIVVSGYQVWEILEGWVKKKHEFCSSIDLGLTRSRVSLLEDAVEFPDGQTLGYGILEKMAESKSDCFYVENNQAYKIQCYSEYSKKFFKLYSTGLDTAPTAVISGIRMHQTKNMDPIADTLAKVSSIKISGVVLDSCMGLGYTAIYACKKGAKKVFTFEKEPLMVEIARKNPWSQQLFVDKKIEITEGDIHLLIKKFNDNFFNAIIHDPPRISLAGELYSREFYSQLCRVLKPRGMLFHYVGNPGEKHRNKNITVGVRDRLRAAGFKNVEEIPKAQGIKALK